MSNQKIFNNELLLIDDFFVLSKKIIDERLISIKEEENELKKKLENFEQLKKIKKDIEKEAHKVNISFKSWLKTVKNSKKMNNERKKIELSYAFDQFKKMVTPEVVLKEWSFLVDKIIENIISNICVEITEEEKNNEELALADEKLLASITQDEIDQFQDINLDINESEIIVIDEN